MTKDMIGKILDATLEVVAREKISGTRMHLIAKEAKMSQSNLHYYYPTKNELLMSLMDQLQKRFSEKRIESVDLDNKSVDENIHGLFKEKKDDILNHRKVDYAQFDFWVQGTVNKEIKEKFQSSFNEWRHNIQQVLKGSKNYQNEDRNIQEMLPYIMVSLMMGASMQYLIDENQFDLKTYFEVAEKVMLSLLKD